MAGFDNEVVYGKNADFTSVDNQNVLEANGLATNGQLWVGTTAVNAGGTHINVGNITSPLGTLNIGYSSPNITIDTIGGGVSIDSLTPNSGTSPVVPDVNGNIALQGTGSITTVGGLNSLTPQLTGLTNHAVQVGAGTSTLTQIAVGADGYVLGGIAGADPAFTRTLTSTGLAVEHQFYFITQTSGVSRTLFVQNGSNTASSQAVIATSVAGSSAGDAYYVSSLNGGQEWSWGLDNSDSDAFVVSNTATLGTNNVMRVSTAGEINYPLQPAFLAINTASTSNDVTGDGTAYTIIFGTESFDQNGDFDGTSTFTAPVTGRYQFNVNALCLNMAATSTITIALVVAGTSAKTYRFGNTSNPQTVAGNQPIGFSILVPMTATDTATVVLTVGGGAKTVGVYGTSADPRTTFSGYLVA